MALQAPLQEESENKEDPGGTLKTLVGRFKVLMAVPSQGEIERKEDLTRHLTRIILCLRFGCPNAWPQTAPSKDNYRFNLSHVIIGFSMASLMHK